MSEDSYNEAIEIVRAKLDNTKRAVASVHTRSVMDALYECGYVIIDKRDEENKDEG